MRLMTPTMKKTTRRNSVSASRIRILIVDDVAESRDNVEKLLRFEPDVEVVGKAERGQQGIDMAVELTPDVVLMDINMPDMDGIEATMEITTRVPSTAVIMMSVQNEPDILRRAMLAGAREFLSKPFSLDELIEAVRHVSRLARPVVQTQVVEHVEPGSGPLRRSGADTKVISVVSNKGGVGRSFVAVNLAVAIRKLTGKDVILFDTSMHFGDVGVLMNSGESKTILDIVDQAHSLDAELVEDILFQHSSGVRVLLSPPTPQDAEMVTTEHVRATLGVLVQLADYVIIDTRPGFDDTMLTVMDASERMLLLLTMEMTAIKDTTQFLEIAALLGYPQDRIRMVLNRHNTYSGIPTRDIAENLGREIEYQIPEDFQAVLTSVNEGTPLVDSRVDHRISQEIRRLASSMIDVPAAEASSSSGDKRTRGGLMSRLRTAFRPT
jgi:pilus assembly protein CpaE